MHGRASITRSASTAALDALDKKYKAIAASEADWLNGVSKGYSNGFDEMTDIAGTVSDGLTSSLVCAFSNVTSLTEGI